MDMTTRYLGMTLKNPIVHSASPLSDSLDNIRRMEDAGFSAVVMYSLFEEQITGESQTLDHYLSYGEESHAEALSYFPAAENYRVGPDEYLDKIAKAKRAVSIPIIGSLNGVSTGGWIEYAKHIEQAGADALELNIYFIPADHRMSGRDVEKMYIDIVTDVTKSVQIPVAVKLSPFFSAMGHFAERLRDAGARGLVLFNRFFQPDFDLEALSVVPHLELTNDYEFLLPLRWIAILHGHVDIDLALTRGVYSHEQVLKGLMAGANVTMMTSAVLRNGIEMVNEVLAKTEAWLEEHEYESVKQMQGSMSQRNCAEPAAFERANYMKALQSWRPDPTGKLHF